MTVHTETRAIGEPFLEAGQKSITRFWQWKEKVGQALESAEVPVQFLSFAEQTMQEQHSSPTYDTSFTTLPQREGKRIAVIIPQLEGINAHHPALTSKVRHLMRNFWAIVVSKALQASFPIVKTSIVVFNNPSEDRQQIILRVFTETNASQAVAFWESLENDIHEWVSQLDDRNRLIFLRDISLRIHWQ